MVPRPALVALLLYVTLDLSLPAMPGAFVFEVEDSVESVHGGRGRSLVEVEPLARPRERLATPVTPDETPAHTPSVVGGPRDRERAPRGPRPRAHLARPATVALSPTDDAH